MRVSTDADGAKLTQLATHWRRGSPRTALPLIAGGCLLMAWVGCQEKKSPPEIPSAATVALLLRSPAFNEGQPLPRKYTHDGADTSPPLVWSGAPPKTKELALVCVDPDAPGGEWVHWVIYSIPATATQLPEGIPTTTIVKDPAGALQGFNSWEESKGYRGPAPPPGKPHRYQFTLYALDQNLALLDSVADKLGHGLTKAELLAAMNGHILGEARLTGTYAADADKTR